MAPAGSEICTFRNISRARSYDPSLSMPSSWKTSAICVPTRIAGFRALPGFW